MFCRLTSAPLSRSRRDYSPTTLIGAQNEELAMDFQTRLRRFFTANCPAKCQDVDQMVIDHKYQEEVAFRNLEKKYGREPKLSKADRQERAHERDMGWHHGLEYEERKRKDPTITYSLFFDGTTPYEEDEWENEGHYILSENTWWYWLPSWQDRELFCIDKNL